MSNSLLKLRLEINKGKAGRFPGATKPGRDWLLPLDEVNAYAANPPRAGRPVTTGEGLRRRRAAQPRVADMERVETTFGAVAAGGLFDDAAGQRWRKVAGGDGQNAKLYRSGAPMWGTFADGAPVVALVAG
jgi:hypothetical protein